MTIVTVFCGSSHGKDSKIVSDIKDLGQRLGQNASHVLYGGGLYGHLQDIMDAVGSTNGTMDAILPPAYFDPTEVYPEHVNVIKVNSDEDRILEMLKADAFIVTPGGDGTLAESFFAHNRNLSALYENGKQKPIVFLNTNNYYKHLKAHFEQMSNVGYSNEKRQEQLFFEATPEDVISRIFTPK